ncbi:flagellar hook-associated protein FlgL [Calidifontibacillus oryziterrae]|uniref:flagellar hook-associated protein FlgL n=1 Tax=Calidifontibacillus oryziterrae TaxID=1191699 RepID=UPI0002DAB9F5|nr:flagellar hook-associated protein FlgL [Calidifontibacillus oryziterrae]
MRVTQMMLTNSNLSYLSKNYERLGKLQDQLIAEKKITKPSDDPVIAMKGMRYRSQVAEVQQFQRNLNEVYSWMDSADAAFEETTQALQRIRYLTVNASNDSNSPEERANIAKEIRQLNEQIVSIANTRFNGKYIFNGSDTSVPPVNTDGFDLDAKVLKGANVTLEDHSIIYKGQEYKFDHVTTVPIDPINDPTGPQKKEWVFSIPNVKDPDDDTDDGVDTITITESPIDSDDFTIEYTSWGYNKYSEPPAWAQSTTELTEDEFVLFDKTAIAVNNQSIEMEVLKGVYMPVNANAQKVFSQKLFGALYELANKLEDSTTETKEIDDFLDILDAQINTVISERSEIGARTNRVEMVENRLMQQELTARDQMSKNEDVDFEKVIIDLKTQESIHRASLAAGARIIQPTLMDFLR